MNLPPPLSELRQILPADRWLHNTCYCNSIAPGETSRTCRKVGTHRKENEKKPPALPLSGNIGGFMSSHSVPLAYIALIGYDKIVQ